MRGQIQQPSTMTRSSGWALDRQLEDEYLHPSVMRFCAGLPVYRLREITEDNWEIEQEVENPSNGKNYKLLSWLYI